MFKRCVSTVKCSIYAPREKEEYTCVVDLELGYGTLQSTSALCALRSIINFKLEMINSNCSIEYPYQNLLVN
jgi:hypothetical protein